MAFGARMQIVVEPLPGNGSCAAAAQVRPGRKGSTRARWVEECQDAALRMCLNTTCRCVWRLSRLGASANTVVAGLGTHTVSATAADVQGSSSAGGAVVAVVVL
jgi:hypothetical protein